MRHPVFLLAVLFASLTAVSATVGAEASIPERMSLVCAGVTVFYDKKDEELARKFSEHIPELEKQASEELGKSAVDPATVTLKMLRERRDEYLAVIASYLGMKKPNADMETIFNAMLSAFEKRNVEVRGDWLKAGIFDTVQIWRREDLVAELKAHGRNDFFELDNSGKPIVNDNLSAGASFHVERFARSKGKTKVDIAIAPVRFGLGKREKAFLLVMIDGVETISIEQELQRQLALVKVQIENHVSGARKVLQEQPSHIILHETVEMAIVTTLLTSKDRRWFCEGMANLVAYRALVELASPEAARRGYDLRDQLVLWKSLENAVDLPQWKILDELTVEEKDSALDRARYAYATKAISNVYEKYGCEFFPRWCREIARTPRSKANIATVHAAFEKLTGEKLSAYYPRPLFSIP
jgi:hypothetical protein